MLVQRRRYAHTHAVPAAHGRCEPASAVQFVEARIGPHGHHPQRQLGRAHQPWLPPAGRATEHPERLPDSGLLVNVQPQHHHRLRPLTPRTHLGAKLSQPPWRQRAAAWLRERRLERVERRVPLPLVGCQQVARVSARLAGGAA
eukprot:scaffold4756_cov116-Isochrysis_galbana.AAC.15